MEHALPPPGPRRRATTSGYERRRAATSDDERLRATTSGYERLPTVLAVLAVLTVLAVLAGLHFVVFACLMLGQLLHFISSP